MIEYVPKPKNRFWKLCRNLAAGWIAAPLAMLTTNAAASIGGAITLYVIVALPLLLIGAVFKG